MFYAWYSRQMALKMGYVIYLSADGLKQVKTTFVSNKQDRSSCAWEDLVYVGIVTTMVEFVNGLDNEELAFSQIENSINPQEISLLPDNYVEICHKSYYGLNNCSCEKCFNN